ncbi:MAG: J domain-containing protein, partial [Candidatus Nealsonbacteria bacterium]|nr:J domain-containing protein [Candidatus Nealsonbacteria bacterium]
MSEDYYKTLKVARNASQAEIQRSYRDLARKHHPDVNPDDKTAKQTFQRIQKAFDVLNDPEKREMYDRYGSSFETRGAGRPGAGGAWGGGPGGGAFEDFDFSQIFGQQPGGQPAGGGFGDFFSQFRRAGGRGQSTAPESPRRGRDIRHEVQIPFNTSITGGEVQITMRRQTGKTESISVKIPSGIEDGKKIRVRGQGEPGPHGGTPGDVLITVRVTAHPCFQRRGNHLHVKVPITLSEAALGAKVDLPTPQGTVSLTVPPGTSGGDKLRVKGHGVRPKNATPGDLFAEIQIVLP